MSTSADVDNEQYPPDAWLVLPRLVAISVVALAAIRICGEMIWPDGSARLDLAIVIAPIVVSAVITSLFGVRLLLGSYGSVALLGSLVAAIGGPILASPLLLPLGVAATPAAGWALGVVLGQIVCPQRADSARRLGTSPASSEGRGLSVESKQATATADRECWIRYGSAGAGMTIALVVCAVVAVERGALNNDTLMYGALASAAWVQAAAVTAFLTYIQRKASRRRERR
jgi:hypothetical protein